MAGAVLVLGISGRSALSASPNSFSAFGFNPTPNSTVYSNTITVSAQGGVAPYTYSWVKTSGISDTTASNPTLASTLFYVFTNGTQETTWTCTVTDSASATVDVVINCSLTAGFIT